MFQYKILVVFHQFSIRKNRVAQILSTKLVLSSTQQRTVSKTFFRPKDRVNRLPPSLSHLHGPLHSIHARRGRVTWRRHSGRESCFTCLFSCPPSFFLFFFFFDYVFVRRIERSSRCLSWIISLFSAHPTIFSGQHYVMKLICLIILLWARAACGIVFICKLCGISCFCFVD